MGERCHRSHPKGSWVELSQVIEEERRDTHLSKRYMPIGTIKVVTTYYERCISHLKFMKLMTPYPSYQHERENDVIGPYILVSAR